MKDKNHILNSIKSAVKENFPEAKIILYGSRSRGDAKKDSDWDLLILLKKKQITYEIEQKITNPLYDLELEYGEVISPMIYSDREWNTKYSVTPYYKNVMKEGKEI